MLDGPAGDQHQRSSQLRTERLVICNHLQGASHDEAADNGEAFADAAEPLRDEPHDDAAKSLREDGYPRPQRPAGGHQRLRW
jgi:hypothetical protein